MTSALRPDAAVDLELRACDFFAAWARSFDGMCDAFRAEFAPHCDWDQRPMMRTRSIDGAIRFLRVARAGLGLETIDVEMLSVAATGNVVHTARVDHILRRDGSVIASAPVCGVLTYSGDRLVHWKEYFDPTVFAARAMWSNVRHLTRIGRRRRFTP